MLNRRELLRAILVPVLICGISYKTIIEPPFIAKIKKLEKQVSLLDEQSNNKSLQIEGLLSDNDNLQKKILSLKDRNTSLNDLPNFKKKELSEIAKLYQEKIGFIFEVDNIQKIRKPGTENIESKIGLHYNFIGTEHKFEINEMFGLNATYLIRHYNGNGLQTNNTIIIRDGYLFNMPDGVIDTISIYDDVNGTKVSLENKNGIIRSNSTLVNHESATQLFESYAQKYHKFIKEHNIGELMQQYQSKFQIIEHMPK